MDTGSTCVCFEINNNLYFNLESLSSCCLLLQMGEDYTFCCWFLEEELRCIYKGREFDTLIILP